MKLIGHDESLVRQWTRLVDVLNLYSTVSRNHTVDGTFGERVERSVWTSHKVRLQQIPSVKTFTISRHTNVRYNINRNNKYVKFLNANINKINAHLIKLIN